MGRKQAPAPRTAQSVADFAAAHGGK